MDLKIDSVIKEHIQLLKDKDNRDQTLAITVESWQTSFVWC